MKKSSSLFFCIVFSFTCYTQSLNGVWNASYERSFWVLNSVKSAVELNITNDSLITGVEHDYFTKGRFSHTKITGKIIWKDSIINIEEIEEISTNVNPKAYESCFGKMQLRLTREGNTWFLRGKWKDKDTKSFHCPTLDVVLQKEIVTGVGEDTIAIAPAARATVVQKVIELNRNETDSIKFAVYDDGVIDGDTATLYFNDSLIVNKRQLSELPFIFYLSLNKNKQFQKIQLFADNLGSIPPNTALLIITTKENRYEIRLSSDDSQNGSVEFFLKE